MLWGNVYIRVGDCHFLHWTPIFSATFLDDVRYNLHKMSLVGTVQPGLLCKNVPVSSESLFIFFEVRRLQSHINK